MKEGYSIKYRSDTFFKNPNYITVFNWASINEIDMVFSDSAPYTTQYTVAIFKIKYKQ